MTVTENTLERPATMPRLIGIAVVLAVLQVVTLAVITARLPEPDSHPSPEGIQIVVVEQGVLTADDGWALDPALFVLPRPEGVSGSVWMRPYELESPDTHIEIPRTSIDGGAGGDGELFDGLLEGSVTSRRVVEKPPTREFDLMDGLKVAETGSRLRIEGTLQRRVLRELPDLPRIRATANVLPSVVRLIVDARGTVIGVALTSQSGNAEADDLAKRIASGLRFEPLDARTRLSLGSGHTTGNVIFDWSVDTPKEGGE